MKIAAIFTIPGTPSGSRMSLPIFVVALEFHLKRILLKEPINRFRHSG